MPKVKLNPIFEEVRGQVGNNMVIRRTYEGRLSLMKKPDMFKVEWSEAQAAHTVLAHGASAVNASRRQRLMHMPP